MQQQRQTWKSFSRFALAKSQRLELLQFPLSFSVCNDKKGKTKLEKRTCKHFKLYHSAIEAKKMYQRNKAETNQDVKEEETDDEEEDDGKPEQNEQEEHEPKQPPNAEKENDDDDINMDRVNIFERIEDFLRV